MPSIQCFRVLPRELFRISNGRVTRLRDYGARRSNSYDILTINGKAQPKALHPETYSGT